MKIAKDEEVMKLEDQVCSLESAKRLKELGVKQESLFYWFDEQYGRETSVIEYCGYINGPIVEGKSSAFTVAELGLLLPEHFFTVKYKDESWEILKLVDYGKTNLTNNKCYYIEAEARAKMLIYILENGLAK